MKWIAILGCENSHATTFLKYLQENPNYENVKVRGVYSDDPEAAEKVSMAFGVDRLPSFESAVGQVDGLIITARHGDSHYRFAKPYIASGIPMFIDKPITVRENDAVTFMRECKHAGVAVTGGSCLKYDAFLREAVNINKTIIGGYVRAPVSMRNDYGNFYFYAQHLIEPLLMVFGRHPGTVQAFPCGDTVTVVIRYKSYDITALFVEENYFYHMSIHTADGVLTGEMKADDSCFRTEFNAFHSLLYGGVQEMSYEDFIAPVFVMNAIVRSLETGQETTVREFNL